MTNRITHSQQHCLRHENTLPNDSLWKLTAEQMINLQRSGTISATDLASSSLQRITQINPKINAIIDVYAEEALATAKQLDNNRDQDNPLRGIPVTIKDNIASAGHGMSKGVVALKDNICHHDAALVANLRKNGAIITGRTNCPPFCWQLFSTNELYGATTNPVNPRLTPGGSSGGAAASVASGIVPIAHGNDIAGSIRYPAYANAIVGLRPTNGVIPGPDTTPDHKPFSYQLFPSQGVLARTVNDAFLGFDSMRGYFPGDPANLECIVSYRNNPKMVGIYLGDEIHPLNPTVKEAVLHAAHGLQEQGWHIDYLDTHVFEQLFRLEMLLIFAEFLHSGTKEIDLGGDILRKGLIGAQGVVNDMYGTGYQLTLDDYLRGLAERGSAIRELRKIQERYPVILMPVSAEPPFLQNEDQTATAERAKELVYATWPMDTLPVAGLPGIVLPTDVIMDGIHLGVQLSTRLYDETTLHKVAHDLETYFDLNHEPVTPLDAI